MIDNIKTMTRTTAMKVRVRRTTKIATTMITIMYLCSSITYAHCEK